MADRPTVEDLKDRDPALDDKIESSPNWMSDVSLRLVSNMDELQSFLTEAKLAGVVANDLETTGLNPEEDFIVGISLSYSPTGGVYIPLRHQVDSHLNLDPEVVLPLIQDLANNTVAIFHNGSFDVSFYEKSGVTFPHWEDTMASCYMLNTNRKRLGLKYMSKVVLGCQMLELKNVAGVVKGKDTEDEVVNFARSSPKEAFRYAASDAVITLTLYQVLEPVRKEQNIIYRIETAVAEAVRKLEQNRVAVDVPYCKKMQQYVRQELASVKSEIYKIAGRSFDIDSPKQCGEIVFELLKVPHLWKKTKSGNYDTSADHFNVLKAQHPICGLILLARSLAKALSTYIEPLIDAGLDSRGAKFKFFNWRVPTGRMAAGSGGEGSGYAGINVQSFPSTYGEKKVNVRRILTRPGKREVTSKVPIVRQFQVEKLSWGDTIAILGDDLLKLNLPSPLVVEGQEGKVPTQEEADRFLQELDPQQGVHASSTPLSVSTEKSSGDFLAELGGSGKPAASIVEELMEGSQSVPEAGELSAMVLDMVDTPLSALPSDVSISDILSESEIVMPSVEESLPPLKEGETLPETRHVVTLTSEKREESVEPGAEDEDLDALIASL